MTQQEQNPHREENTVHLRNQAVEKSPLLVGTKRPIAVDSYFAQALRAITSGLLEAEAEEHGRLIREGKARAKAARLAAQRDSVTPTKASASRP
ncbi:hypothetical protein SK224_01495 [Microbacterium sp. BG28]|uniref:hypothetical protein n=1 Tax=Microbacterium sp. BG28 TaxID=3097356 RepID=UPI002A5B0CD9|nr:hypothetical protein [Microbacterium sp. BG28]MDY0827792.1 hypothetical protein [Microbacterium sp. BG28]